MIALPPTPLIGSAYRVRLPRDYYVPVVSNDYSVDPTVVGRFATADAVLATGSTAPGKVVVERHDLSVYDAAF